MPKYVRFLNFYNVLVLKLIREGMIGMQDGQMQEVYQI